MIHVFIDEFINEVCDILDISIPNISFDTSSFLSDTMMALYVPSDGIIYLKKYDKINSDQLFSIAHELRHIWQMQNDEELYFSTYKQVDQCSSIEEYNLQLAELDANAFSALAMISLLHLRPLFNGLSEFVKSKIHERMDYLLTTEFPQ